MPLRCSTMPFYASEKASCSYKLEKIKPKSEYITDVTTLGRPQLLELLERQKRLIKSLALSKLPDKGEKVNKLIKDIEDELERRDKTKDISDIFTKLSINENNVDIIEWDDKNIPFYEDSKLLNNDIVEDEQNPLIILATHSGTSCNKKKILIEKEEDPLVTLADIEEVYALNLCNKIDKTEPKTKFLPHKTLKSNSLVFRPKIRHLSSATPPLPVFGDAKLITLADSLKLQFEQTKQLKELQIKHATERLKGLRYKIGDTLPSVDSLKTYRDKSADQYSEEDEESENEIF